MRGDLIKLKLGGQGYDLNPGPAEMARVAKEVGCPIQIMTAMTAGAEIGRAPPLVTMVQVFRVGLDEAGHDFTEAEVMEMVHEAGALSIIEPFAQYIGALVNGGKIPTGDEAGPGNRKARRAKKAGARKTGKPSNG